ncbi:MAG: hemolysin III family protein [Clostridiales bacterium]|nr:hemolysin III family protein [Clostridiales bacterium]
MVKNLREPVNGITHLIGAILSLFALIAMIVKVNYNNGSLRELLSILFFGIGMILLYSASFTYHSVIANSKIIMALKRLDHSMIFILIAGSYAPYCLVALNNKTGIILFSAVAIASIIGIIFKLAWVTCPRWLSSTIYIAVGWFAVFAIYPISKVVALPGVILLFLGGVMYTIGGVIYALKKDKIKIGIFGSHEIFHIFIMLGSLCHFISVYMYII